MLILRSSVDHPAAPAPRRGRQRLLGPQMPNKIVNTVALSSTGISFACALEAVREFLTYVAPTGQIFRKEFFDWIVAGNFRAGFDLQMDQLTVVMVLVVTGVGFLSTSTPPGTWHMKAATTASSLT